VPISWPFNAALTAFFIFRRWSLDENVTLDSLAHEGRVPGIESQTEGSGRSHPRLCLRGR
jgi:hypothetical protein